MKTRIIAAAVLVPILFLIVLIADKAVAAVVMGALLAIGSYELLYRTGLIRRPRLVIYSSVMAFAVSIWSYLEAVHAYFLLLMAVYFILMFSEIMMDHVKVRFEMLGICFFSGVILPYMLSSLVRILMMSIGRYVILIPFVVAFMSDAGAYFVGIKFGKHKLAPVLSPNKTIEGVLGGFAGAIIGMLLYTLIMDLLLKFNANYAVALLYGILGSAAGTFGDLCFSVIKRQTGIKDYGNLIPGHGGVLDRFDSLVMVAPLMEALLLLIPVIVA
jgi:phosphatidate cytidylyltransferase